MSEPIHIISLGAGVQSSTMALMAACGEITPMPACAIFADTQAEPKSVYEWLGYLAPRLPFPVIQVTAGSLEKDLIDACKDKSRVASIPAYTLDKSKVKLSDASGILWRQCTQEYKLAPLLKKTHEIRGGEQSIVWIGISMDEIQRRKDSRHESITHRWPLMELEMDRDDCLKWMKDKGFKTPPRSACTFCPYHSDKEWRRLKEFEPEAFSSAVKVDQAIRTGWKGIKTELFVHKSRKPLAEADLSLPEYENVDMFDNACEGLCGV